MELALIFELAIVVAVVSIQLYSFQSTWEKIKKLQDLFPEVILDDSYIQTTQTNPPSQILSIDDALFSGPFNAILDSINRYLIKNRGTADFSIIKSIVERTIESRENSVSVNISLPLYVGLMGTFVGIITGLAQIAFAGGVTDKNINSFIGGVVIAMIASFFGLALTVLNNSRNFKNAKAICDERKNNFYNFLQVELLPHLGNSLYDALDRLKANINDFNKKFENNINLFDVKFSVNITSLKDSVDSLYETINLVTVNTRLQKEFLAELKAIGYNRMAEANMRVFTVLKEAGPTFIEFIQKQKELNVTVNNAVHSIDSISAIFDRVKAFEESINNLGTNITTNQFLGNDVLVRIDKNLNYLDKQFELLKNHEIKSSENIEDFFEKQYRAIQILTDNIKREIEEALNLKIQENPFKKLLYLESLDSQVKEINKTLVTKIEADALIAQKQSNGIPESIPELHGRSSSNEDTKQISSTRDPQTMEVTDQSKNEIRSGGPSQPFVTGGQAQPTVQRESMTFLDRVANIFSRSRGRKR